MKNSGKIILAAILLFALGSSWFIWQWFFCRFYVGPNQMAVIISKHGTPLPDGHILAEAGQKGIQRKVLGEGRHFLNPVLYDFQIKPVVVIAPGKVGIVTAKIGKDLPEGEFLAEDNQKGIWRKVLGPGKYRMNPYGYKIDIADAISIPIGYCGVITSLSGKQAQKGKFAEDKEKGVRKDILQPGLYYINPKAYKIDILEIGVNQVSLLGKEGGQVRTKGQISTQNSIMEVMQNKILDETKKKRIGYLQKMAQNIAPPPNQNWSDSARRRNDRRGYASNKPMAQQQRVQIAQTDGSTAMVLAQFVEFPSRDGFQISLDMTVEVELLPENISWIFSRYGDLPAVVDKVIMPQITSISRNKGSEYQAKDFIMGEGRENFQTQLTKALSETLAEKKIIVHNALIRHVEVPRQILTPIQQASIAVEQNLTNIEKQNTARKLGQLNTETSLIEQKREQVVQETTKLKAEIKADEEKQVAQLKAEANRDVAEIGKQTAGIEAETVRIKGQAQADAISLIEGEKARGVQLKTKALGDPQAYSLLMLARSLRDNLKINILHSGDGTLWTDLEKAGAGNLGGAMMLKKKSRKK